MATARRQRWIQSASTEMSLALGGAAVTGCALLLALGDIVGQIGLAVAVGLYLAVSSFVWPAARAYGLETFGAANSVTLTRAGLASLLAGCAAETMGGDVLPSTASVRLVLVIALLALATDACDGWLARRLRTESRFGARFDMETDAVFMLVLACLAWILGKAGVWILAAGLMRYLFVAAGVVWPALAQTLPPSFRRKLVCVLQISALIVMLAPQLEPPASALVGFAALALLTWSFAVDLVWLALAARPPKPA